MAIGNHNYPVAFVVTLIVVLALFVLEPVQRFINRFHKVKDFKIRVQPESLLFRKELEDFLQKNQLQYRCMKITKENFDAVYLYRVSSQNRNYQLVNQFLLDHKEVKGFDV